MQDYQDLLNKARALGEAMAAHPRIKAYNAAKQAVQTDANAQRLLRDYTAHVDRIQHLEMEGKPIEVADKQKLADLEKQMAGNDALKQLMRSQADYVELMHGVNQTMSEPLAGPALPDQT